MKKLALALAMTLMLSLALASCGKAPASTPASGSAPASTPASSAPAEDEALAAFNPDALGIKVVDDKTLEVKLVARTPYFLELTAFPTYAPVQEKTVTANGEAWATTPETYIGNGPYKVTEWVPGSKIVYTKNENYWDNKKVIPETINFVLMEEDAPQLAGFQNKELAFVDSVPNDEIDALSKGKDFYKNGQIGTYYVSYNVTAAPFDNKDVRKAFTLAVDRDFICKEIGKSGQIPAGAFVSKGLTDADPTKEFREVGGDYYDPTKEANEKNLAEAKKILADAGFPEGEGLGTVTYLYNAGTGHQAIGEALQNMWSKLAPKATFQLESQEWGTFLNTRKEQEYQVARNGWLGDYNDPISFLDMWITDGGNNDAGWSNPEYDKLITEIKNSGDAKERMTKMHEAEDMIFEDWMLCPIYYYVDIFMANETVKKDVIVSPLGFKHFQYVNAPELSVCTGPNPDTIDPALNSAVDGGILITHAFEGLYSLDTKGVPVPAQAKDVKISEDGLTYTFTLRDDLKWSDGTPLTAKDFAYSWTRAIDPNTASDYAYMFECIEGYAEATAQPE
ncbi:MAG: ABC transporter substrate-binding protein [Oscillospiraceae bacterium]